MTKHKIDIKKKILSWEKSHIRKCDRENCNKKGEFKAPKSRISLNEYFYFCLDHVKEYNKSWDFYKGLSVNQIENSMRHDIIWNRPSWPLKGNPYKVMEQINNFFNENNLPKNKKKFLLDLISLSGDISVMKELKKVMKYNKVKNFTALNNLESIAQIIQKYKSNCDIQIDLCELHGLNYQSSLAYTAYIPNLRKEIARGGRYLAYDTYSNNPRTAIGFSLDIKDLLDILLQKRPYHV